LNQETSFYYNVIAIVNYDRKTFIVQATDRPSGKFEEAKTGFFSSKTSFRVQPSKQKQNESRRRLLSPPHFRRRRSRNGVAGERHRRLFVQPEAGPVGSHRRLDPDPAEARDQCFKTFYDRNLQIFVIS
jgi:hypothetical protein